jgi:hypothetical protein
MKLLRILFVLIVGVFVAPAASDLFALAGLDVHPIITAAGFAAVNVGLSMVHLPLPTDILMFNVGHILRSDSAANPSGVQTIVYWAYNADIDNYPEIVSSPASSAERITLESTTGFTMLAGKNFKKLSCELETGQIQSEPIGEAGGQNYLNKATIFYSGTSDDITALAAELKNSQTTWLIPEHSGDVKVIGSDKFPATCKCTLDSGKGKEDRRGLTVEIEAASPDPAYKYTGSIDVDSAS